MLFEEIMKEAQKQFEESTKNMLNKIKILMDTNKQLRQTIKELEEETEEERQKRKQEMEERIEYNKKITLANDEYLKGNKEELNIILKQQFGYTKDEHNEHIQSLFEDGMSWSNYIQHAATDNPIQDRYWTIGQIENIPWAGAYNDPETAKIAFALSNLKPKWVEEDSVEGTYLKTIRKKKLLMSLQS